MLKKIKFDDIREGMYIHELCASWISSPFWQKSFLIETVETIEKIRKAEIREVWIDTEKGCDVLVATEAAMTELEVVEHLVSASPVAYDQVAPVSMDAEMGRAAQIVGKSKGAVVSMFTEARMGKAIEAEQAMPLVEEIAYSVMRNPGALIGLARLKTADDYTYMHSVAVCALMIALSRQLKLTDEETREAGLAGLLHDIGKMAVPAEILNKPGKLTDAEFVSIKEHPAAGYQMLLEAKGVGSIALDVCLHHHEKMDGSGYPEGLEGDQISLYARMGAVCDVYDAITSNRPYKAGWCPAESLRKMSEWSRGHFDDRVFQAFVKSIGIYPVGTLVKLHSGRLGVVVEQQVGKSLLLPKVRVFFSSKSMAYITPLLLDLSASGVQDKIVSREDATAWGLKDIDRYWLGDAAPV
ncbi:MAG: HD-GYP domain-containing protein [Burkholderiales bacterium]|nr:HD-GYP domain-containing protein [Burkholderiales bacterium]